MSEKEVLKQYTLIENNSKKYYNGSVWDSISSGKFTIIGKTNRANGKGSFIYCLCKFEDGAIVEADFTNIKKGNVKSPNKRSVYGIGYMCQGKWKSKINKVATKEYSTWLHMMRRCYSEKNLSQYTTYKDVEVCERWHNFQNFCEDIQHLSGYDEWKDQQGYELDKDTLCEKMSILPKIYSPETCIFISKSENVSESTTRKNLTGLTYVAVSPLGEKYEFTNAAKFSKENNLSQGLVSACIHKKRTHHKGWTFEVKVDQNEQ